MTKIKVTQDHISKGTRKGLHTCPVALAIADITHNVVVVVEGDSFIAGTKDEVAFISLPMKVREEIKLYDSGSEMLPFEFELEIPQQFLRSNE